MKKRKLYYQLEDALLNGSHNVFLLLGLRKTGKTTILKQLATALNGLYVDCRETALDLDSYYALFEAPEKYIFVDELGYFDGFDQYLGDVEHDLDNTDKKIIFSSSSYGLIKQLSVEKLGASRAKTFELFPLSFEEYLYFSDKIGSYNEDYEPTDKDIQDFYRLVNVPKGMDFLIDREYMMGTFKDAKTGWDNQLGTVRDIELEESDFESAIDIIAYTLNNKIALKRFMGSQIGVQEFLKNAKGLSFSSSLVGLANRGVMKLTPKKIGRIIAYLFHSGYLFADLRINEEETQSPDRIIGELLSISDETDLERVLKRYTLSVISPLLYTRLLVDMEKIADRLCESSALYGELYELTMKSESIYKKGYVSSHISYKYNFGTIEVDLVDRGRAWEDELIMEFTITHKSNSEHNIMIPFPNSKVRRILTDTEGVFEQCDGYTRIGYPKALLMMSNEKAYNSF